MKFSFSNYLEHKFSEKKYLNLIFPITRYFGVRQLHFENVIFYIKQFVRRIFDDF